MCVCVCGIQNIGYTRAIEDIWQGARHELIRRMGIIKRVFGLSEINWKGKVQGRGGLLQHKSNS